MLRRVTGQQKIFHGDENATFSVYHYVKKIYCNMVDSKLVGSAKYDVINSSLSRALHGSVMLS
jgi:hypothetical protein